MFIGLKIQPMERLEFLRSDAKVPLELSRNLRVWQLTQLQVRISKYFRAQREDYIFS